MPITIEGAGTISGLSTGGLPNGSVTQADLASGVAGNGPSFRAYFSSATQGVSSGVSTKVILNAENFDTANCFDSTTNYRFTPNVAGYYLITGNVYGSASTLTQVYSAIYRNGAFNTLSNTIGFSPGSSTGWFSGVTDIVYFNGTTDYVELYAYIVGSGSTLYNGGTNYSTTFSGFLARAA
jgi:hypothetical protein